MRTPRRDNLKARAAAAALLAGCVLGACAADRAAQEGVRAFYAGDFASAAVAFRPGAERRPFDENSILNSARLGMAELAAGRAQSAVRPLGTAYQLLESGSVNDEGRILAATVLHEGVRVYKGEPFEQAMTYTALAWANALRGDWENVRVCARSAVRRLADYQNALGNKSRPGAPETDFALGYFLEGLANAAMNEPDLSALDRAVLLNAALAPHADRVRARDFNAVIVIEAGRGPEKEAYGDDNAQTRWAALDSGPGSARIEMVTPPGSAPDARGLAAAADVNRMSEVHRWNNLQDARSFKSGLGSVLVVGGAGTAVVSEDKGAQIAGISAAAAGLLMKALSSADVRHNELLPAEVFVAVLKVPEGGADVRVSLGAASRLDIPGVRPGTPSSPSVVYARVVPRPRLAARAVTSWGEAERLRRHDADIEAERVWNDISGEPP